MLELKFSFSLYVNALLSPFRFRKVALEHVLLCMMPLQVPQVQLLFYALLSAFKFAKATVEHLIMYIMLQVALGQVNSSKAAELGIGDVSMDGPTVVVFCNGNLQSAHAVPLAAEKKGRALIQVLGEYKGGAKCRQGAQRQMCMGKLLSVL